MAILHSPKIIFLDEPTIGLDVVGKNELRNKIKQINRDHGITVLLVTHDVIDIAKLCTRTLIIDKGKLVWNGSLDELKNYHGHRRIFTVEYTGDVETLEKRGIELVAREGDKYQYHCDSAEIGIDEATRLVTQAGKVVDLQVTEPEIEEVIRRIYAK